MNKRQIRKRIHYIQDYVDDVGIETVPKVSLTRRQVRDKKLMKRIAKMELGYMYPKPLKTVVGQLHLLQYKFNHEKDFGTKWNQRMDELGARRGNISDLRSI